MALNDDIAEIKAGIAFLRMNSLAIVSAIEDLPERIKPGNTTDKTRIFNELTVLLNFIAKGKKLDAIIIVRRLTECGLKEAKNLVEIIHVADPD